MRHSNSDAVTQTFIPNQKYLLMIYLRPIIEVFILTRQPCRHSKRTEMGSIENYCKLHQVKICRSQNRTQMILVKPIQECLNLGSQDTRTLSVHQAYTCPLFINELNFKAPIQFLEQKLFYASLVRFLNLILILIRLVINI